MVCTVASTRRLHITSGTCNSITETKSKSHVVQKLVNIAIDEHWIEESVVNADAAHRDR